MTYRPMIMVYAGPNGSGKSTITQMFEPIGVYINADDIQVKRCCCPLEAAQIAEQTRELLLARNEDFTFETVLSTPRNIDLLKRAREKGYFVLGVYVLTCNPKINVARVKHRKMSGGHDVPEEKVIQRYYRAMALIPDFCSVCSRYLIFDNSADKSEKLISLIAEFNEGKIILHPNDIWQEDDLQTLLNGKYHPEYPK